ncbi:hypothetical protein BH11PSE7_BH11PSE7_26800 [soil metagenome]
MSSTTPHHACTWPGISRHIMARTALATTLALVVATAAGAQAQVLWDKAASGMTAAEVAKAVPGSKLNSATEASQNGCGVSMDNATVGGAPFNVCFVFTPDTLGRVLMRQPDEYLANAVTQKAFAAVSAELTRRYGKEEVVKRVDPGSSGLMGKSAWHQGRATIELRVTPMTPTTSGLVVFITTE